MDIASVSLIVAGAVIVAVVWLVGTRSRAREQQRYADIAEHTERSLSDVHEQLAELNRRTGEVERILKDAE